MYIQTVYLQTANHSNEIILGLANTAIAVRPARMLASISYSSLSGCKNLHKRLLEVVPKWKEVKKDWLIGLDNGITEPRSLEYLKELPNSTVHVFDAEYLLNNNLNPRRKFHPKLYFFESNEMRNTGMFSGSANLTLSGLFLNTEQAISIIFQEPVSQEEQISLDKMNEQKRILEEVFENSIELSDELCERYKNLCRQRQEYVKNEDERRTPKILETDQPEFDVNKSATIATASNYWVEILYVVENLGKGIPGNQIDLQRGSRVFFGFDVKVVQKNTIFGTRLIRYRNQEIECGMRFGNNSMDKLNLPPPSNIKIDTYEEKILLFSRMGDEIFRMQVFPHDSIERFRRFSNKHNSLYKMKSGREYGVF